MLLQFLRGGFRLRSIVDDVMLTCGRGRYSKSHVRGKSSEVKEIVALYTFVELTY